MKRAIALIRAQRVAAAVIGVVVLIGGFFLFSNGNGDYETVIAEVGPFVQEVSVSGKVRAVSDVSLGFSQGGRVERVLTTAGETVFRGALLAEVENDSAQAVVLQKRAALLKAEADLADTLDGARPEEVAVSEAAVSSARVVREQAVQVLIEEAQDAFRAADDAVRVQVDQFFSNPETNPQLSFTTSNFQARVNVENERVPLEAILDAWAGEVFVITPENAIDAAEEAKVYLNRVATFLALANSALNQAVPTGSVTISTLEGYAVDITAARSAINTAIVALTTAETALKNADTALVSAERSLTLKEAPATASTVAGAEADVAVARAALFDAEAQLRKTYIVAPFTGVVTAVSIEPGEIVGSQDSAISLISEGRFQIESFVPEINIARLAVGDAATVTLDAYGSDAAFGARVISLDPAETIRDGVSTYRALLEFDTDDARIRAGMTANVRITTESRDGVLTIPQGVVTTQDGKRFVRVLTDGTPEEREITVGAVSSFGLIEILSGLSAGDQVVK